MGALRQSDLATLLEVVSTTAASEDLEAFRESLLDGLGELVPCDIAAYVELDLEKGTAVAGHRPSDPFFLEISGVFKNYSHEHPQLSYFKRTRDPTAVKVSDFVSQRQLHRLGLYDATFRRLGTEHQMVMYLIPRPRRPSAISLDRGRHDFTERDRGLLNLLRPHLAQAYRSAETRQRMRASLRAFTEALEQTGQGVVTLAARGQVEHTTARARDLLAAYYGRSARYDHHLPDEIERWLMQERSRLIGTSELPRVERPLVVAGSTAHLVIQLRRAVGAESQDVLILNEQGLLISSEAFVRAGLTRRQAEILFLVAEGKTDAEIATSLFVSRRTVEKHLEHIYDELGVRNRAGAVSAALLRSRALT